MKKEEAQLVGLVILYTVLADSQVLSMENQKLRYHKSVVSGFNQLMNKLMRTELTDP